MKPQVIIFIYLGGSMLHFVKCFSSGCFDKHPYICQTMAVSHSDFQPQKGEPPYKIDPDNITVGPEDVGKSIEVLIFYFVLFLSKVTLKADRGEPFNGFMLEARKPGNTSPQGIFALKDERLSRLQQCDGINGKAVTQTDNQEKTEIRVTWNAPSSGVYFFRLFFSFILNMMNWTDEQFGEKLGLVSFMCFFRATFTKSYNIFWLSKDVPNTTLAPPTTSAIITSDNKPSTKEDWVTSFLSLAFSLAAFILSMIHTEQVVGKILAGVLVSLNLGQTILIFLLCGLSHKLRKIFFCVLRVVAVTNLCFTASEHFVVDVLEGGKMGKCKDLSEFDKGQIVMARRLDQSISKTAALVECSRSAV
ncbi:hypothetical protein QTP86_032352, partial [Hemibagrus guttatus]